MVRPLARIEHGARGNATRGGHDQVGGGVAVVVPDVLHQPVLKVGRRILIRVVRGGDAAGPVAVVVCAGADCARTGEDPRGIVPI